MRLEQYVYFSLRSESISTEEITRRVGLAPDAEMVRGSKSSAQLRPKCHSWEIHCKDRTQDVGEQAEQVVSRLISHQAQTRQLLAESPEIQPVLQMVRYFNAEHADLQTRGPGESAEPPGKHERLGWHLPGEVLRFLAEFGAEIDSDEYDLGD